MDAGHLLIRCLHGQCYQDDPQKSHHRLKELGKVLSKADERDLHGDPYGMSKPFEDRPDLSFDGISLFGIGHISHMVAYLSSFGITARSL